MPERSWPDMFFEELNAKGVEEQLEMIDEFVRQNRAEDLYLDFIEKKDPKTGGLADDDRRNYAKAISGFAHSEGGILIWGVQASREAKGDPESPDVARERRPISNLRAFHSNLNAYVREATTPPVDRVKNLIVWDRQARDVGYIVTYIPVGSSPPYRATICNNKFYKRAGSSFYAMEPFDIRDVVFRLNYPKIKLMFSREDASIQPDIHVYSLAITLRNEGPRTLESWKIVVEIPRLLVEPITAHQSIGFTDDWSTIGNAYFRRFTYVSHPRGRDMWIDFIPLFPEEEKELVCHSCPRRLYYAVTNHIYHYNLPQKLYWRFYPEEGPMQAGEIVVKATYEANETVFCNF